MFLQLAHTNLDAYKATKQFVVACYTLTEKIPQKERYSLISQIRRAALSTHLNLAEGCSGKSKAERCRFFEISRGSIIEVDAALDIVNELNYMSSEEINSIESIIVNCYKYMSGLIKSTHN